MIVCERRSVKGSVLIEMETEGMVELSVILSIFHYFGGYFHMRNLAYFRRLFSRYSYRSPGRPSNITPTLFFVVNRPNTYSLHLNTICSNHVSMITSRDISESACTFYVLHIFFIISNSDLIS